MTTSHALFQKKVKGHELIEQLVATGKTKPEIYFGLQNKLGCKAYKAHFANMYTEQEVDTAIIALEGWLENRVDKIKKKEYKGTQLTLAQQKKAFKNMRLKKTWYGRLLLSISGWLTWAKLKCLKNKKEL